MIVFRTNISVILKKKYATLFLCGVEKFVYVGFVAIVEYVLFVPLMLLLEIPFSLS